MDGEDGVVGGSVMVVGVFGRVILCDGLDCVVKFVEVGDVLDVVVVDVGVFEDLFFVLFKEFFEVVWSSVRYCVWKKRVRNNLLFMILE